MLTTILFFSISLVLIIGMLSYKIIMIRQGKIAAPQHFNEAEMFWPDDLNFKSLKMNIELYSIKGLRLAVLFLLKVWIKSVYFVRKEKEILMPKIHDWAGKIKAKRKANPTVSGFIQNISDYKSKLKTMSEQIKKEEMENIEK